MRSIILDEIVVSGKRVDYYFSITGNLQKYFKKGNHLFFEYNYDVSDINKSILTIPFIANIIPLAWITDTQIAVEELDYSFYNCLGKIKNAYQNMYPSVKFNGDLKVKKLIQNSYIPEKKAAQLFSGGLDALATFIRNKSKHPMLITEYGWHKSNVEKSEVWEADQKNVISFSKNHGLDNIFIHSNYGTFLNAQRIDKDFLRKLGDSWWHGLHHSLAIISAAIPVAVKLKIGCIYIASSFFQGYKAKCASDPTVDNEIKYASGTVFHDGYDINRQDKVKLMVDYYATMKQEANLRVCFMKNENCCKCEKCLRTIIGIVAEGEDPNKFGFNCPDNLSRHVSEFLEENIKFFTPAKIMQWNLAKNRMRENSHAIKYCELLSWFLEYDFKVQRKRALLKYRITKLFPILKRRFHDKLREITLHSN